MSKQALIAISRQVMRIAYKGSEQDIARIENRFDCAISTKLDLLADEAYHRGMDTLAGELTGALEDLTR